MPSNTWEQRPFRCDRPALDMAFQEIGVFLQVFRVASSFFSRAKQAAQISAAMLDASVEGNNR